MREILTEIDAWQRQRESIAVATLLRVRRSAPRLPGACLAVTRSGKMAGSVSGGCVENDVFERAMRVLDTGRPVVASYGIDDEAGLRVGLSCGGTIDVLIEPFEESDVWRAVRAAVAEERPAVLCVAVSPPPFLGHKLAVVGDAVVGSIDRELDERLVAEARRRLSGGVAAVLTLPWRGGEAEFFVDPLAPPLRLFVIGATHIAVSLCRLAKGLGFRTIVVDPRGIYATRERFPDANELSVATPGEVLGAAGLDAHSYVVVLTHDAKFDVPSLALAVRSEARYVGALGSSKTHEKRRAALLEDGFSQRELERIHAPIGLDIGARTPDEIALAIFAEIIAVRYDKEGRPLRDRRTIVDADR